MTYSMLCASVADLLEPWHDGELPLDQQVAVEGHLAVCAACSATARELTELRRALLASQDTPPPAALDSTLDRMTDAVISRVRVERELSWPAQFARLFEDMHLVWAGLAATGATAACIALVAALLQFAPDPREDSLSGVLAALAAPGSNRNPVRIDERTQLPRLDEDDVLPAMFAALPDTSALQHTPLAVAGIVTQEGVLAHASLLSGADYRDAERRVINTVQHSRFRPAQRGGEPVAVNLVWLLEQTTVRGKI
ncbi:MAG TPA: zf-HC2 domain-containing protein [Vicinamibacterales bacterium]